jgi:hypothetical protein
MEEDIAEEREESIFEDASGVRKRTSLTNLNKKRITKHEMDEMFASQY